MKYFTVFSSALAVCIALIAPKPAAAQETDAIVWGPGAEFLGVGAELMSRRRGRGPMIGVRAGYVAMPSPADWQLYERAVSGAPTAKLTGPYVRLVVGTGRMR